MTLLPLKLPLPCPEFPLPAPEPPEPPEPPEILQPHWAALLVQPQLAVVLEVQPQLATELPSPPVS